MQSPDVVIVVVLVEVVEEVVVILGFSIHLIFEFLRQDIVPLEQHVL